MGRLVRKKAINGEGRERETEEWETRRKGGDRINEKKNIRKLS